MKNWQAHITVAGVLEKDNQFLLVREMVEKQLVYNQAAGHLEQGESLFEAVQREVWEETGYTFKPQKIIGIYEYLAQGNQATFLRVNFSGEISDTAIPIPDDSILETVWLSIEEIEAIPESEMRSSMVKQATRDYIKNINYPIDLLSFFDDSDKTW